MDIEPFGVEIWMNEFELTCDYNLAETCVYSITVGELLEICGEPSTSLEGLLSLKLSYGAIQGSDRLRAAIVTLYENQKI
ncbi:MAG: hypothetical protein ACI8W1_002801, partial [Candidatus Azotimanducaceae bacterium]